MVGLAFAMPAFAVPSKTSETFPQNGQMQEDTKYIGQATETNLHSYEGPVTATANYTDTPYTVTAGNYLPMSSETVAQCTSGNYCPGINGTVNYSTSANQGLTACPNGYPNSLAGATSDTECYTACTVANAGIDHASAVSGNDYYGTGVDTCVPTECVAGWHLNPGAPDLATIIGETLGENSSSIDSDGWFGETHYSGGGNKGQAYYGITEEMSFAVDYGNKGMIRGKARCSTQSGDNQSEAYTNPTMFNSLTDATGQPGAKYCYCQLDGYTPNGGTMQPISTPWVFEGQMAFESTCGDYCAGYCAENLVYDDSNKLRFRAAFFNNVTGGTPTCDANVISITWDGADQTDIDANDAGQCTYGGDINTPKKAVHVPGKTFVGWTFDTPSGN